ncbi:BatD family protein [Granulosicoccus sp.]|nr:BatD family protein [Granulosicoccus sp.]MDB4222684.1 BatD family protein [Granulosicoccus sp.]
MKKKLRVVSIRKLRNVFLLFCLFLQVAVHAQDGTVQSKLSANTITRDESVTLEVTAIGMDAELDISSLQKDFEVVGRSSSREVRSFMEAGSGLRTTSFVNWALELVPREIGIFTVPPVRVGNVSSQAHTLTVNELPTGAKRDIFVEAFVDTETPWVQSQVLMTMKVFQAIEIVDGGLDVPEAENLVVERLGEDVRSNEIRDGRQYSVTTRRFALFPQKSGELLISPITLSISVPADPTRVRGFFSPTRKLTRRTDKIVLNVKPRPNTDSVWWLPAKAVQLDSQWIGDVATAAVDQPLTRTIVLRASGVTDSQLPEINIPAIEGASLYAEEPERKLGANESGVLSELTIKWAVIPQRAGELLLPSVSVDWFNTSTGSVETAVLPAEKITVSAAKSNAQANNFGQNSAELLNQSNANVNLPNAQGLVNTGSNNSVNDQSPVTSNNNATIDTARSPVPSETTTAMEQRLQQLETSVVTWRYSAIVILALWLISCLAFLWMWYQREKSKDGANSSNGRLGAVRNAAADSLSRMQPLGGVVASCKMGNPDDIRHALIEWSARQWPDNPPLTLGALAKRLSNGAARHSIESLDAALYSPRDSADEQAQMLTQLSSLPENLKAAVDDFELKKSAIGSSGQVTSENSLPAL